MRPVGIICTASSTVENRLFLADAGKNDASIFADEMMAIADKHGFQPATVAEVQQANYLHQRSKDFYNPRAQDIRARWARGEGEGRRNAAKRFLRR